MWRLEACTHTQEKNILVLWVQFTFLRFKLKDESPIQGRDRSLVNCGIVLKTWRLLLRLKCVFSQVLPHVFVTIKRKYFAVLNMSRKTSHCCYTNQIASILLRITDSVLIAINIGTSNMTKNIRSHNGCTSFIYF